MNTNLKVGIVLFLVIGIIIATILYSSSQDPVQNISQQDEIVQTTQEPVEQKPSNQICEWVDNSDIIVKVNFTESIVKESSYEAGFYFNSILSTMRIAREECDYRTGFSFTELKGKGAADVGVRNYSDSVRRELVGEPIDITFDSNGVPDIGTLIEG